MRPSKPAGTCARKMHAHVSAAFGKLQKLYCGYRFISMESPLAQPKNRLDDGKPLFHQGCVTQACSSEQCSSFNSRANADLSHHNAYWLNASKGVITRGIYTSFSTFQARKGPQCFGGSTSLHCTVHSTQCTSCVSWIHITICVYTAGPETYRRPTIFCVRFYPSTTLHAHCCSHTSI